MGWCQAVWDFEQVSAGGLLKSLSLNSGSYRIWAGTTVHFICSTLHFVPICLEADFQALNTSFLCKRIIWVIGLQRFFSNNGFDLLKESEWEFYQKQMHSRDIYYCSLTAGDFALVCFIHLIKNSLEPCKKKNHRKDVRLSTNIYHTHRVVFSLHVSNKLPFFLHVVFCQLPIVSSYMNFLWLGPRYPHCCCRLLLSLQIYSSLIKKFKKKKKKKNEDTLYQQSQSM